MYGFNEKYQSYLSSFESYLAGYSNGLKTYPEILGESMRYSLLSGGKRVRPVLMLAVAEVLELDPNEALPFAVALEMIHTYSLIHDDLPAMDNDDFRRGKPSNHKAFGEANAILAGDALLNEAFSLCLGECLKGEKYALAAKFLSDCAGKNGMIAGQPADLYFSTQSGEVTEDELLFIHENKTGKLLLAPVIIPSILSENRYYLRLEQFGKELGRLFQITDDILDVTGEFESMGKTLGKDATANKLTYVKLYGLEGAKIRADECAQRSIAILESMDADTQFLKDLVAFVRDRKH
ncbi:MAG: polyprenyl synthetase family protein [Clostridia bacterium]|nr:polyprenyl synthetase family protein [Clostridia bacterium]